MSLENIAISNNRTCTIFQDIDKFHDPAIYLDNATVLDQQLAGTELTVNTSISAYLLLRCTLVRLLLEKSMTKGMSS